MEVIWGKIVANVVGAFATGFISSLATGADVTSAACVGGTAALGVVTGLFQDPYKGAADGK